MQLSTWAPNGQAEFNALLYPQQHPNVKRYLERQYENLRVGAPEYEFYMQAKAVHDSYYSDQAAEFARQVALSAAQPHNKEHVGATYILPLFELEEFQEAGPAMQRWAMANPVVRERWHGNLCDGWSDTYFDQHPGDVGKTHYDFMMVTDGVVQTSVNEKDEAGWSYTNYSFEMMEGDRPLTVAEKSDLQACWLAIEELMKGEIDPTSVYGERL
jgi:hypothetical protein